MDAKKHDQREQKEAGEDDIIVAEGQGCFKKESIFNSSVESCWGGANAKT